MCQEFWPSESLKDRLGLIGDHSMAAKGFKVQIQTLSEPRNALAA